MHYNYSELKKTNHNEEEYFPAEPKKELTLSVECKSQKKIWHCIPIHSTGTPG